MAESNIESNPQKVQTEIGFGWPHVLDVLQQQSIGLVSRHGCFIRLSWTYMELNILFGRFSKKCLRIKEN